MRARVHPGLFLTSAVVLCATWLWLRPPAKPAPTLPSSTQATARPADTRPSVQLDPALLERYAGRYAVEGFVVTISVDGQRLLARADGTPPIGMRAASETKFFFEDFTGTITFEAGEPAPAFVADVTDGRHRGVRIGR